MRQLAFAKGKVSCHTPHAQHINKVLLSNIVLLVHVPLERGEYILPVNEVAS
jgi:hypothetical protein